MFRVAELRKILVISSLRKTVYYIDNMKSLLNNLDTQDNEQIERSFQLALENLNERLRLQFKGIRRVDGVFGGLCRGGAGPIIRI
ncbi:hypothetical protein [Paenibacillus sp. DMB5]|uniref:hypothetical protein n=1 Tax=Paenibacillus sp. DMB5 TaxID=1780103 RepID=UPI00076C922A|nr:hypothetical protein [Paenibacillus sp. DMB5]KUP23381.1 hypothetical protein AWJ19_28830 [Paenibacillus sp. DMB5]